MTEEPIFNPRAFREQVNTAWRGEWVRFAGARVYVREMAFRDSLFVLEHSQRMAGPGGPALSLSHMQTWQILVSCYDGAGEEARRIFEVTDIEVIQSLKASEAKQIMDAIERVNSLTDAEVDKTEAFTLPERDAPLGNSRHGVSSTSTASLESWGTPSPPVMSSRP